MFRQQPSSQYVYEWQYIEYQSRVSEEINHNKDKISQGKSRYRRMNHCSRNWSRASRAKIKKGENRSRVGGTKRERTNEAIQRFALLKRDNQDQTWTCRRFQMETDSRSFYGLVTFLSLVAQSFVCVSHPRITISQILRFKKTLLQCLFHVYTRRISTSYVEENSTESYSNQVQT